MVSRKSLSVRLCLAVGFLLAAAGGCNGASTEGGDSETHFLARCEGNDNCAAGLECICGVCTRACITTAGCSDLSAEAQCGDSCQASGAPQQVCGIPAAAGAGGSGGDSSGGSNAGGSEASGAGGSEAGGAAGKGGNGECFASPDSEVGEFDPTAMNPRLLAMAAAVVGACHPDDGVDRNVQHMWTADLRPNAYWGRWALQSFCLAEANCGCQAMQWCLGAGLEPFTPCTAGCNGDVFTLCEGDLPDGYKYVVDCAKVGMICHPEFACVDSNPPGCDAAIAGCSDAGEPESCVDNFVQRGPVCADHGLACVSGQCVNEGGASCTNEASGDAGEIVFEGVGCVGGILETCVNGTLGSVDCSTRGEGFSCHSVDGAFFCGLAAECVPASNGAPSPSHPASCDGTTITFCNAGRLEQVDCLSLGFAGCEVDTNVGRYGCVPGLEP